MAARRKCSVSKENSSFVYAEQALPEDTEELNPPVCRERLPCQGMGRDTARGQEDMGSFQELKRFYSKHQFPLEWPISHCCILDTQPHCWMGSGGCVWLKVENRGKPPQNQRGLQIQPQKQEGFKPTPKPEWSEAGGKVDGKKEEKIKVGSQLTQPQLQI